MQHNDKSERNLSFIAINHTLVYFCEYWRESSIKYVLEMYLKPFVRKLFNVWSNVATGMITSRLELNPNCDGLSKALDNVLAKYFSRMRL